MKKKKDIYQGTPTAVVSAIIGINNTYISKYVDRNRTHSWLKVVDPHSNHCRAFAAKTKYAAIQFQHFMLWLKRQFDV